MILARRKIKKKKMTNMKSNIQISPCWTAFTFLTWFIIIVVNIILFIYYHQLSTSLKEEVSIMQDFCKKSSYNMDEINKDLIAVDTEEVLSSRSRRSAEARSGKNDEKNNNRRHENGKSGRGGTRNKRSVDIGPKAIHLEINATGYLNITPGARLAYLRSWTVKDLGDHNMSDYFYYKNDSGQVQIKKTGLYLVYTQITYQNIEFTNSFQVMVNGVTPVLQCILEHHRPKHGDKGPDINTCFTSAVVYIKESDEIGIGYAPDSQYFKPMLLENTATFWGLAKLS